MKSDDISTEKLGANWELAKERLALAKGRVEMAEAELSEAMNALGARIDPGDMEDGERLGLWVRVGHERDREEVLIVTKCGEFEGKYRVESRGSTRERS